MTPLISPYNLATYKIIPTPEYPTTSLAVNALTNEPICVFPGTWTYQDVCTAMAIADNAWLEGHLAGMKDGRKELIERITELFK